MVITDQLKFCSNWKIIIIFGYTVRTDDQKLSQESNLTTRQLGRTPITIYISFNKRRRLANEGLMSLTEGYGTRRQHHASNVIRLSMPQANNRQIQELDLPNEFDL